MTQHAKIALDNHVLHLVMTDASDPDLSINLADEDRARNRASVASGTWTQLRQVHGSDVVSVNHPGHNDKAVGDALVTTAPGAVLAVQVADCVPVALWSDSGAFALAHAGWKGTAAGVIEASVFALRSIEDAPDRPAAGQIKALVGYCVCASCYEFSEGDLATMVDLFGPSVRARAAAGTPALDMRQAVSTALSNAGVGEIRHLDRCTSCSPGLWSHRARGDRGRQALVGWLGPQAGPVR